MHSSNRVETLALTDARWHASAVPFRVHWIRQAEHHHLVLEAPNWANARKWGVQAALAAWRAFQDRPEPPPLPGVESLPGPTRVWLVQPGFPVEGSLPLWQEPFSGYANIRRNPALVHPVYPVYGADVMTFGTPLPLASALAQWGAPLQLYVGNN